MSNEWGEVAEMCGSGREQVGFVTLCKTSLSLTETWVVTCRAESNPHLAAMLRALERPGMPHSSLYVGASATSSNSTLAFSNLRMCEGGSEEGGSEEEREGFFWGGYKE